MTDRLDEAVARLRALPEDVQQEAADMLLDFVAEDSERSKMSAEQREEIRRRMAAPPEYATDAEVAEVFDRLTR